MADPQTQGGQDPQNEQDELVEEEIIEEIIEEIMDDDGDGDGGKKYRSSASVDSGFSLHLPPPTEVQDDMTNSGYYDTGTSFHASENDPFSTVSRESTNSSPDTLTTFAGTDDGLNLLGDDSLSGHGPTDPLVSEAGPIPTEIPTQTPTSTPLQVDNPTPAPMPMPTPGPAPAPVPTPRPATGPPPPPPPPSTETQKSSSDEDGDSYVETTIASSMIPPPPPPPPQMDRQKMHVAPSPPPPPQVGSSIVSSTSGSGVFVEDESTSPSTGQKMPVPSESRESSSGQPTSSGTSGESVPSEPDHKTTSIPNESKGSSSGSYDPDVNVIPPDAISDDPMTVPLDWFDESEVTTRVRNSAVYSKKSSFAAEDKAAQLSYHEEHEGEDDEEDGAETIEKVDVTSGVTHPSDLKDISTVEENIADTKETQVRTPPVTTEKGSAYDQKYYLERASYSRKRDPSILSVVCLCLVFLVLCAGIIYLILGPLMKRVPPFEENNPSSTVPPDPLPPTRPAFAGNIPTTPMEPYMEGECDFRGQDQPNVLSQCECNGRITSISEDVRQKYEALKISFVPQIYDTWDYSIGSCDPTNQALFWLSTTLSFDEFDMQQRFGLATLYYGTEGGNWIFQSSWLEQGNICSWYGVTCSDRVVSVLSLGGNDLDGRIPSELGLLAGLTDIDLSQNMIDGFIPGQLFLASELREISLANNDLEGSLPSEIGLATNLEVLILEQNNFAGEIPSEMQQLTQLSFLSFEKNNQLTGRIPTEFGLFTDLVFFSISDTNIRARIPSQFGALTKLKDFRMANTLVGGNIPDEVEDLNDLLNVDLGDSRFRKEIPAVLGNLRDITYLSLANNGFTGAIPSELGLLTKLTTLELNGNELIGPIPTELGELNSLVSLTMQQNGFTGRMPEEICDLRSTRLQLLTSDCPRRDEDGSDSAGIICPVPYCCTSCTGA